MNDKALQTPQNTRVQRPCLLETPNVGVQHNRALWERTRVEPFSKLGVCVDYVNNNNNAVGLYASGSSGTT